MLQQKFVGGLADVEPRAGRPKLHLRENQDVPSPLMGHLGFSSFSHELTGIFTGTLRGSGGSEDKIIVGGVDGSEADDRRVGGSECRSRGEGEVCYERHRWNGEEL